METETPSIPYNPTEGPWASRLEHLKAHQRFRQLRTVEPVEDTLIEIGEKRLIDFSSNDYLGLSRHRALIEAAIEATQRYGTGSGGSRLINGTLSLHRQLESTLAQFKGTPAALVFNSGYQANLGVLSALVNRNDVVFADKLNHASLVDGALLSRANVIRYPHLDFDFLEARLQTGPVSGQRFIVSDTVFSMDGDCAPLLTLYELACKYDAWLILDEAHATGIFGKNKRSGLWETTGLGHQNRVIQIGTFSKALGSFGAYVAASAEVIDMLVNTSRSFIYSTALPPGVVAANLCAIDLVWSNPEPTERLWEQIALMAQQLKELPIELSVQSPIIPVILGGDARALACAQQLFEAGFFVQAVRPPSVPEGTARLRLSVSSLHHSQQLQDLGKQLKDWFNTGQLPTT